jgi:DNA-binding beta-propeller fold protein YncE
MKNVAKLFVLIAIACLGTASFAAISGPTGLAVDAKGNLYVANFTSNQVLVYGPGHKLITTRTISAGISGPLALALDPAGNLWVANYSGNSLTGYTPTGTALRSISIAGPTALAVDGLRNFWAVSQASTLQIFDFTLTEFRSADVSAFVPSAHTFYSIAAFGGLVAFGTDTQLSLLWENTYLTTNVMELTDYSNRNGVACAFDASGKLWDVDQNGAVGPLKGATLLTLPYRPSGMAVDSVRHLFYFSNNTGNSVDVYSSTTGLFVTTIH